MGPALTCPFYPAKSPPVKPFLPSRTGLSPSQERQKARSAAPPSAPWPSAAAPVHHALPVESWHERRRHGGWADSMGRVAVVTGAGGGVAPAVVRRFAAAGYGLALVTRPDKQGEVDGL